MDALLYLLFMNCLFLHPLDLRSSNCSSFTSNPFHKHPCNQRLRELVPMHTSSSSIITLHQRLAYSSSCHLPLISVVNSHWDRCQLSAIVITQFDCDGQHTPESKPEACQSRLQTKCCSSKDHMLCLKVSPT